MGRGSIRRRLLGIEEFLVAAERVEHARPLQRQYRPPGQDPEDRTSVDDGWMGANLPGASILMFEPSGTSTIGDRHVGEIPDHVDSTTGHELT